MPTRSAPPSARRLESRNGLPSASGSSSSGATAVVSAAGDRGVGPERPETAFAVGDERHAEPFGDDRDVDAPVVGARRCRQRHADLALARALGLDRPARPGLEASGSTVSSVRITAENLPPHEGPGRCSGPGSRITGSPCLLSDVHGNRSIARPWWSADGATASTRRALGDLVAIGPDPVSALDLLVELPGVKFVRGNTDRYVVSGDRPFPHAEDVERDPSLLSLQNEVEASFCWTRDQMSEATLLMLAALPYAQRLVLPDGARLLGVHASPRADDDVGITPDLADDELATLLSGADADVICAGHTHRPADRQVGEQRARSTWAA